MPASQRANLVRVAEIIRKLDETCMAAAKLRRRIQRDMRAIRARDQLTFADDPGATAARVRKTP